MEQCFEYTKKLHNGEVKNQRITERLFISISPRAWILTLFIYLLMEKILCLNS